VFVDRDVVVSQLRVNVVTVVIAPHRTADRSRFTGQRSEAKGERPEVSDQWSRVKKEIEGHSKISEVSGRRSEVGDQRSRGKNHGSEVRGQ